MPTFPQVLTLLQKYIPADQLDAVGDEIERAYVAMLSNSDIVHINMLRGTIAKPSFDQFLHLYGEAALARWRQSFNPAYTFMVHILDQDGHVISYACGQVHAENENAAQEIIQDRVDMVFPDSTGVVVLLSKNHPLCGSPPFQIIDNVIIENPSEENYT